jgi:hypothetical protein
MSEDHIVEEIHKETSLETFEDYYADLKLLLESAESDVLKSAKGNASAKVRLRKTLRLLKTKCGTFVKFSQGKLD